MSVPSDDDTATLQAHALFVIGRDGALAAVNDVGRPAPPACFVSMTSTGIHYWTSAEPSPTLVGALEAWRHRHNTRTNPDGFTGPPEDVLTAAATPATTVTTANTVAADPGASARRRTRVFCGPAFRFPPADDAPAPTATVDVPADVHIRDCPPEDSEVFRTSFPELTATLTERTPVVAAFVDDRPVAVCLSSRTTAQACEAGVQTLPDHRRRGLAAAVTARWAERVRASGRTPLYSTSWDNTSSQSVARRLGLVRYAVTLSIYVSDVRNVPTPRT